MSTSANFWMLNFGTTQGGARRVGPQTGPEGWSPEGRSPEGWGAQNFALFFSLLPPQCSFFFLSLGFLSWNFGGVFEGRGLEMCTFGVLGLSCASPGGHHNSTTTHNTQHTTHHNTTTTHKQQHTRSRASGIGPAAEATLDGDGNPHCVSRFPQALRRLQLKKERCTRLQDMCLIEAGVNGARRRERRTNCTEGSKPETDETVPRIEFDFADLGGEEDQALPIPFTRCGFQELVSNTVSHEIMQ